ncbi:MAG: hypothetical protein IT436_06195 [Phycisphaerales bacterium]|nr:hypothetical protein [Phycisphaerales bacterium]
MTGRRRFRVWRVACWMIIALAIAARIRGTVASDHAVYGIGELISPPAATDPSRPAWWTFRLRDYSIGLIGGSISTGVGSYDSLGPDPAVLSRQWDASLGPKFRSGPPAPAQLDFRGHDWFDWAWPDRLVILGAGIQHGSRQGVNATVFTIPLWLIAALAAMPLFISWSRQRRLRRRLSQGRCTHCGYHRAGLAPEQPCPECGRQGAITTPTTSP